MDESEYRSTYHQFNQNRCIFEKAILSRRCGCHFAHKFCLAEREGVACQATEADHAMCEDFLLTSRQKALFALKLTRISGQIPHAKEIRVQLGSLIGLTKLLGNTDPETLPDAHHLIHRAKLVYKDWKALPFEKLVQEIVSMQKRRRRKG